MHLNIARIALATLAAMVAYFAYGFAMFAAWPSLQTEFLKYPNVYRAKDAMMKAMPFGMVAILASIAAVAVLYAKTNPPGGDIVAGLSFGAWMGLFVVCVFVIHNWVNLNIGIRLTVFQAIVYFLQWLIVGAAIGLVYQPA